MHLLSPYGEALSEKEEGVGPSDAIVLVEREHSTFVSPPPFLVYAGATRADCKRAHRAGTDERGGSYRLEIRWKTTG